MKAIVNVFSEGRENYKKGSERMVSSAISSGYDGDIITFSPQIDENVSMETGNGGTFYAYKGWPYNQKYGQCLPHEQASHQFKSFIIQFAKEKGYDQVMWCDCPVVFMKNPQKYFDLAEEIGVVLFNSEGGFEAEWTSDIQLELMGCSIEFARMINQCYSGVMIYDFRREFTNKVFDDFMRYSLNKDICNGFGGSKREEFIAPRNDQSIISYVIRKYGGYTLSYGGYIWVGDIGKLRKYSPTFINYGIENNIEELYALKR